jgi:hypothetical protein
MEVETRSSSISLSDPPTDYESTPGPVGYSTPRTHPSALHLLGVANPLDARHAAAGTGVASSATPGAGDAGQEPQPAKKPRKKREVKPKDPNAPPVEKKPRQPRRPRGASAAAAASGARKRTKVEPNDDSTIHIPSPQNPSLQSSTLVQPVSFAPQSPRDTRRDEAAKISESGLTTQERQMHPYTSPAHNTYDYKPNIATPAPPPQAPVARSTAMYDPIRGTTVRSFDPSPPSTVAHPAMTPPRPAFNPSTSPAISGIIDHLPQPSFPSSTSLVTNLPKPESASSNLDGRGVGHVDSHAASSMDVDLVDQEQLQPRKTTGPRKVPSEASTRATSPKPTRAKEQPPPPPMGSGLLSASLFGGDSGNGVAQRDSEKGPNIVLHVDLKDPKNRVINFAKMAEEKYGFAALYPRQAAQKERMAKIAAAGAALERTASGSKMGGASAESGDDDQSVDIDRESENDGDVAMSGVNGGPDAGNSATDEAGPKRRRRRKVEEYDVDDDFVDDSEMLWEAQAAASKDGFFVYCGPLVPEGEKPAVERYVVFCSVKLTIQY